MCREMSRQGREMSLWVRGMTRKEDIELVAVVCLVDIDAAAIFFGFVTDVVETEAVVAGVAFACAQVCGQRSGERIFQSDDVKALVLADGDGQPAWAGFR